MANNPKFCKYCTVTQIRWNTKENRFEELDGTYHDRTRCEAVRNKTHPPAPEPQAQPQPQPQGQSRYETHYLIPKQEWTALSANIRRLTEYYGEMLEHMSVLTGIVKNNQRLAEAEADFDRDKEDGL